MMYRLWKDISSTIDLLVDIKSLSISQWDVETSDCSHFGKDIQTQK